MRKTVQSIQTVSIIKKSKTLNTIKGKDFIQFSITSFKHFTKTLS